MLSQIANLWAQLERRQQTTLLVLGFAIVAGLIGMAWWISKPLYAVLYAGLSAEDAAAVVEQLREQSISYRLKAGGGTVEVPQEKLYELRLELAGKGLPHTSVVGFELFDRASFSASDLENSVNLQRALQGELERSISTLDEVTSARVHLALPEERLFTEQQQQASAAVVVGLSGGRLTPLQVGAITQLVASAVPNLPPDAVTVVDTAGRILSGGWDEAGGFRTLAQFEARRAYEDRLRDHLQSMLDAVLGAHKSVVRVQAALDFQSEDLTKESVEPAAGEQMVTREEITEETYSGEAAETGGPAGIATALPTEISEGGGSYSHKHESREYDYSRNVEQIHKPPGRLQRLTVAAVIDEELGMSLVAKVSDLITAAAGIDPERGDQVTVETMKIDAIAVAEEAAKAAEQHAASRASERSMRRALHYGSFLLMAAMVAATLYLFLRRLAALPQPAPAPAAVAERAEPGEETEPAEQAAAAEQTTEFPPAPASQEEAPAELVSELSTIGADAPDVFARQLRGWIGPPDTE